MQRSRTATKPTICVTCNPNFGSKVWTHWCTWLRSSSGLQRGSKCLALCAWTSVPWRSQQNTERILLKIYLDEVPVEYSIPQLKWLMSEDLWSEFAKSWQPHFVFAVQLQLSLGWWGLSLWPLRGRGWILNSILSAGIPSCRMLKRSAQRRGRRGKKGRRVKKVVGSPAASSKVSTCWGPCGVTSRCTSISG